MTDFRVTKRFGSTFDGGRVSWPDADRLPPLRSTTRVIPARSRRPSRFRRICSMRRPTSVRCRRKAVRPRCRTCSKSRKSPRVLPPWSPPVSGMHIQRDGTERWLVIDNKTPDQVWPQIRRFWQEQGFLLVVDAARQGRDGNRLERNPSADFRWPDPQHVVEGDGQLVCDGRAQQVPHASRSGAERRHLCVRQPEGHARSADGHEQRFEPVAGSARTIRRSKTNT